MVSIQPGDYHMPPNDLTGSLLMLDPALDSGDSPDSPVVWAAAEPSSPPRLLGGPTMTMADLKPCGGELPSGAEDGTGAGASLRRSGWRLPAGALCLDLVEAAGGNTTAATAIAGNLLPNTLGGCRWERSELSWGGQPLTLARWPNTFRHAAAAPVTPGFPSSVTLFNWTHISGVGTGTISTDSSRPAAWAAECGGAASDCWLHGYWKFGWADSYVRFTKVTEVAGAATLAIDPATPPLYSFEKKARFYALSLLTEMDAPGEYYVDKAALALYVLPPQGAAPSDEVALGSSAAIITTAATAAAVRQHSLDAGRRITETRNGADDGFVAARSRWAESGEAAAMRLAAQSERALASAPSSPAPSGLSFVTFRGLDLRYAYRGLSVAAATGVVVEGVSAVGMTHTGVSLEGSNNVLRDVDVSGAGCSAAHVGGGDTASLTPGNNTATGVRAVAYSRLTRTYTPAMSWSGVGNTFSGSSFGFAPHNGWLGSGNGNLFENNVVDLLCFEVSDSGAWYSGRSWSHRGNTLRNNTFTNIINLEAPVLGSLSIQAIYNDDQLCANTFEGNTFINCHKSIFIGGGRRHVVRGNRFISTGVAVHIDDRGLSWQKSYCTPPNGTFFQELDALHYQQPPWSTAYPALVNISTEHPCVPVYNNITGNCYNADGVPSFTDVTAGNQAKWLDTFSDNTSPCP